MNKKLTIAIVAHDQRKADIQMLLRQCRIHNVPIACNRYSADLMITSTLWDNVDYMPTVPKYVKFARR